MRTVWVTVLSVWALFAVVAVLAWTRQQPAGAPTQGPSAVIVQGKNGKRQLVLLQGASAASSHATTRTSPVPVG
jgi:cyanate permease